MHDAISNPDCVWVKSLPKFVGNWPQWSDDEKKKLARNARVNQLLEQQEKEYEAAVKSLLAPVQQSPDFGADYTADMFRWAVSLVLSRSFEVTLGDEKVLVIIPLVDYLNHKPFTSQTSSVSFDDETQEFRVFAREATDAGGEVYITYGAKSNAELLVCYGFVLKERNPYDSVCIKVGFDPQDPLAMQKRMMMPRGMPKP
eukprot:Tamp_24783.p1 GENE.Tamp_24783~~Tamp_24783.p1  ORF type:complete len:200 (+),score=36.30 Tamp_24783:343-942(+)